MLATLSIAQQKTATEWRHWARVWSFAIFRSVSGLAMSLIGRLWNRCELTRLRDRMGTVRFWSRWHDITDGPLACRSAGSGLKPMARWRHCGGRYVHRWHSAVVARRRQARERGKSPLWYLSLCFLFQRVQFRLALISDACAVVLLSVVERGLFVCGGGAKTGHTVSICLTLLPAIITVLSVPVRW